jgi:hypothetical protein
MLNDESTVRVGGRHAKICAEPAAERAVNFTSSPRIFHTQIRPLVSHSPTLIRLTVKCPSDESDRVPRHDLFYEADAASNLVLHFTLYIKSQVHFFEIYVIRNRYAENACVEEHEADEADKTPSVVEIELRPVGDATGEQRRIDLVVRHNQITPFGGQKFLH